MARGSECTKPTSLCRTLNVSHALDRASLDVGVHSIGAADDRSRAACVTRRVCVGGADYGTEHDRTTRSRRT